MASKYAEIEQHTDYYRKKVEKAEIKEMIKRLKEIIIKLESI